jgi:hypothetical protein
MGLPNRRTADSEQDILRKVGNFKVNFDFLTAAFKKILDFCFFSDTVWGLAMVRQAHHWWAVSSVG